MTRPLWNCIHFIYQKGLCFLDLDFCLIVMGKSYISIKNFQNDACYVMTAKHQTLIAEYSYDVYYA